MLSNDHSEPDSLSIIIKIVLIGETAVGKTSMLLRYMKNTFNPAEQPTIGMDFFVKEIKVGTTSVKVQFWDTAGQEKYKTLASAYYKVCNGIILVYDVCNRETFEKLDHWLKEIRTNSPVGVKIVLVGNKSDLISQRQVSTDEGKEYAKKEEMFFWETSAKENSDNFVFKAFDELIEECKRAILASEENELREEYDQIRKNTQSLRPKQKRINKSCC